MRDSLWQEKQKKDKKLFFVILIAATAVVVFICIGFVYQIRQTTEAETERYLSELSSSVVYSVDARLQANLDALESIALTYVERKELGLEEDVSYLQKKAEVHKFVSVFVMSADGKALGSDGNVHDFSGMPEIMEILDGKKVVLNDELVYGETKNGFAYGVPIYEGNRITGAVVACNSTEWIRSLLTQTYFEGEGFFHIIDNSGAFVVKSNNRYAMEEKRSFFKGLKNGARFNHGSSLEELKELVAADQSGTVYFTMESDQVAKIGKVIPLSYHNFYLFLVVTETAASRQFDSLLSKAIFNIVVIALLFVSLVVVLFMIENRNNRQLSTLAFVDPVTDGYSQVRFEAEATKCIREAKAGAFTFVSLNVANFKLINDTFGTYAGDRILKHIYNVIKDFLDEDELVCRSFSDNFDLLLKNGTQEVLLDMLSQMIRKINAFNDTAAQKYYLLLTAGVYQIDDPYLSVVHVRDRANVARKSSKIAIGQDLFVCVFYSELERQRQLRNKDLENKMNSALENGGFVVYFQPKVRLEDQKIVGAEALVRWIDPEWGLIPPNDFIPFFEQNRFIVQLDLYVFEQVCKHLRNWLDAGMGPVPISVNLSRVHLSEVDFLQKFLHTQQKYQIPSSLLELELTESILAENMELVKDVVHQIHRMGLSCSIDDFGSGYSSLNLLKSIDADTLKLDKEFLGTMKADNPREQAIIETVVEMAGKLKMTTVAEGVETQEQMDFLKRVHCDMVQGYIISKPIEVSCFEKLIFGDRYRPKY